MINRDPIGLPVQANPAEPALSMRPDRGTKRLLDVLVASVCLVLVSPLLAAVALIVRATSPGPVLFRQPRVGLGRRHFVLYKFRTMYDGNSSDAHRAYVSKLLIDDHPAAGGQDGLYKLEDDPRITPVGRLLRRTSIDELPQLINVLQGDMSLVGPRPVLPWEAELIGAAHARRFLAIPGITGLWQVSGRNALTMRQGFDLDLEYLRKQGLLFDLAILLKTIPVVLSARGVR